MSALAVAIPDDTSSLAPIIRRAADQLVYFAQDELTRVKIGYSRNVARRLSGLQVGQASPLRLIRTVDGGAATERWLHRRFSEHRLSGEWFRFVPEMLSITPPDEVPTRQRVTIRRDIRLTYRERVSSTLAMAADLGLTSKQTLLTLSTTLTEDEAAAVVARLLHADALEIAEALRLDLLHNAVVREAARTA